MEAVVVGSMTSDGDVVVSGDAIMVAWREGIDAFIPGNKIVNPYANYNPLMMQAWDDGYNEGAANYLYHRFAPKHTVCVERDE